jgi:peptide/nickel transport system permease protein
MTPGTVSAALVPSSAEREEASRGRSRPRRRIPLKLVFGSVVAAGVVIGALWPEHLAPMSPTAQALAERLQPPAWDATGDVPHLLGTDSLGRDVLSRVIFGARTTLVVAMAATLLGGAAGTALGLVAGYHGGRIDELVRKVIDVQLAFPYLLLAISVLAIAGRGLGILIAVLAISSWPVFARIVRGEVLSLRGRQFVESARALGSSDLRVVLRHVLPSVVPSLCVMISFDFARVVVLEASLSFLGLGVQPPTPSWGMDLSDSRQFVQLAWWTVLFPGLAISSVVLAANVLGDWVRDTVDPVVRRNHTNHSPR